VSVSGLEPTTRQRPAEIPLATVALTGGLYRATFTCLHYAACPPARCVSSVKKVPRLLANNALSCV